MTVLCYCRSNEYALAFAVLDMTAGLVEEALKRPEILNVHSPTHNHEFLLINSRLLSCVLVISFDCPSKYHVKNSKQ